MSGIYPIRLLLKLQDFDIAELGFIAVILQCNDVIA